MKRKPPRLRPGLRPWGWLLLACLVALACAPSPPPDSRAQAIRAHFAERGYRVVALDLGGLRRNPIAERVYMAPLTYVVEVRSITLKAGGEGERAPVTSTGAQIKLAARGAPGTEQGWAVAGVEGVELPR